MSHWNWLLDPRLTVIGAAVLTLLGAYTSLLASSLLGEEPRHPAFLTKYSRSPLHA